MQGRSDQVIFCYQLFDNSKPSKMLAMFFRRNFLLCLLKFAFRFGKRDINAIGWNLRFAGF